MLTDQGLVYVRHFPGGPKAAGSPVEIVSKMMTYNNTALVTRELLWKLSTEPTYHAVPMTLIADSYYHANIPAQSAGVTVQYYVHATDTTGRSETSPMIEAPDPHTFTVA